MPLCLVAGAATAVLTVEVFTLAWVHSIEKTRWEEDWLVQGRELVLVEARVWGSGAGMEPPADAVLRDGVWHYRPHVAPLALLTLSNSPYATNFELCVQGSCRALRDYLLLPAVDEAITFSSCAE